MLLYDGSDYFRSSCAWGAKMPTFSARLALAFTNNFDGNLRIYKPALYCTARCDDMLMVVPVIIKYYTYPKSQRASAVCSLNVAEKATAV
jgi:hypothetical protein